MAKRHVTVSVLVSSLESGETTEADNAEEERETGKNR